MIGAVIINQDLPVHDQKMWVYISPVFVDEDGRELKRTSLRRRNPHGKRAQRRLSKPWAGRST